MGIPASKVEPTLTHEDVESWDSMNQINLILALESEFGVKLSVDDAIRMNSVQAIMETLEKYGVAESEPGSA